MTREHRLEFETAQLSALQRGDQAAFTRFMRAHEERVFRIAFRWLGSVEEARDVTQEVFLTLSRKLSQFEGGARLSTWVYRVAVNHAKNRLRYLSRRRARAHESLDASITEVSEGRLSAALPGPHEVLTGRRFARALQGALETLSQSHREIVVWRDLDGLTYEEISARIDLPVGTVKSRLHRGRAQLQRALALRGYRAPNAAETSECPDGGRAPRAAKR